MILDASDCSCVNSDKINKIIYLILLQNVIVIYHYWGILSWNSVFQNTENLELWII